MMPQLKSLGSFIVLLLVVFWQSPFYGILSAEEPKKEDISEISFEDLLDVNIVSVSKKEESIFDSPRSASVVTKEEIKRAGCTSIMEVLRLMPGIIVREQTNGNYDIHLRGFDNVPPNSMYPFSANNITLVMIDSRIVYSYFSGGTFWETLPVDLNDIERIEAVRGPCSALYGPNGVAGVINIITRRPKSNGFYSTANVQGGNSKTIIGNGSLGFSNDKFSLVFSGNHQKRNRSQTDYYEYLSGTWKDSPADVRSALTRTRFQNPDERYPEPALALDKYGLNLFFHYMPVDKVHLNFSLGYQDSRAQKIYVENNATPLTTQLNNSTYFHMSADIFGLRTKINYMTGETNTLGILGWLANYNTFEAELEHEFKLKGLSLRPGLYYKRAEYDDQKSQEKYGIGFMGGAKNIITTGFSLRADYTREKLRLVAALRGDRYNTNKKVSLSLELSATYWLNKRNLLRVVYSRSNRSSFMMDAYMNFNYLPIPTFGYNYKGNTDLDLLIMDMWEIGFRSKISEKIQLDIETFYAQTKNYNDVYVTGNTVQNGARILILTYENLHVKARQFGATASLNFVPNDKFHLKAFLTWQDTRLKDFAPNLSQPDNVIDINHTSTPQIYGGFYFNFSPWKKLNLNSNLYFYGSQVFDHVDYPSLNVFANADIEGKIILNAKASYEVVKGLSVFVNARNILGNDSIEFAFADHIKGIFLMGLSFEY